MGKFDRIEWWIGNHAVLGWIALFAGMVVATSLLEFLLGMGWGWPEGARFPDISLFLSVIWVWQARSRVRRAHNA